MTPGILSQTRMMFSMEWLRRRIVVLDLVLGEGGAAFVGDLVAFVGGPDLYDVDFFAGEDHALVGDEADALCLGEVAVGKRWEAVYSTMMPVGAPRKKEAVRPRSVLSTRLSHASPPRAVTISSRS